MQICKIKNINLHTYAQGEDLGKKVTVGTVKAIAET